MLSLKVCLLFLPRVIDLVGESVRLLEVPIDTSLKEFLVVKHRARGNIRNIVRFLLTTAIVHVI